MDSQCPSADPTATGNVSSRIVWAIGGSLAVNPPATLGDRVGAGRIEGEMRSVAGPHRCLGA